MKKYIKLFLAMTLVIISMFSSARLNTTSALGATGAINITGQSITPTKSPVDQYTDINVNMNFSVPSTAKTGGQAIISLPKNLKFVSDTNFNVMSSDNKIVAKAVLNAASKTITLTYTDYVTKKSDIKGSLFFNVRVSPDTASPSKVPINISVNNKNIPIGNVDFVVDPGKSDKVLDKVSWNTKKLADGGITRDYEVRVNAENKPLTNAIVLDKLNTDGMSYVKDSFVVKKGTWAVNSNLKLELKNATVVSVPVNFDASQKSFQVNLGNVAANEGYSIYYKVKIDKTPKNGQQFLNNVTLKADKVTETKNNPFVYQNAGGEAEGYNYSVKIKKVDSETNAALAGASFDVIRTSTNETVKSVTTDANGEALIDGLLNTEYKLVETKAPEGYQLNKEAIVVKTTDFNTSKVALKTISNKKIPKEPTPTNATIELDKQLSGRDLVDGEFSFELYEGSNKIQTVSNKNGKITFDAISYKEVGEHTYTVKEVKGDNSTIAYDSSSKQVTVKVTKDGDKLKSEVVYPDGNTFNNKFTPNAANATIELDKALSGRDLVDGEFSFELYEGSNKLQTTTNKNGKISFDSISYKEVGEHTYTVKEVKGNDSTITYDSSEKQGTVKVTKDGDNLKAEVVYPESKTFSNTFTPKETNATIELDKQLTGRDLVDGEFSFELYEGSNKLQTTTNKNGKISFDSISYKEVGEHTYTVKEVKGDNNTITYDETEKQVTVKVTKDGNELKSEVVYPESKIFNNTFTPKETSATIELDKALSGRDLVDGEFSFELYEGSNKLQTTTNKNGKISFDSISYKEVGEHTYTIKEVKGDNNTITYDESEKQVTVKVTKDGNELKSEVVYPESKTFNNTFTPKETSATIELDKNLDGRDLVDGEFSFELYEGSNKLQTTTNKNGKVTFDSISYKEVGEHTYTIKEVKGENSTVAYDSTAKEITVKVTRDGNNLKTEVVYPESKTFNNTFTPNAANATIELDKALSGRDLVNGEFKFVIKDDQGNQVGSEATNQNGKITFPSIKFEKEGTYNYTVKEVKGENNTINYDKSEKHITINVTKDGNNLKAEVVYQDGKTFNNTFTPNATNASIELDKKLDGRDLVDGEFSFDLYEGSNKLQTVTNKNGKVAFDSISYKEVGEHTYTIKEVKGDNSTITYDESEKQVTVKVTRDGDNLKTEVVYPESKTFNNKFTPNEAKATIELEKQLAGRNLADGEFSFDLYEGSNKLQTTTNKNGKVTFDSISYKEVGEHTYTVKEVKGTDSTIAYDESEKHVTVKVTRDGDNLKTEVVYPESKVFHNLFTPNATSAEFSLKKNLSGRDLKDGEFTFTLFDSEGKAVKTVSNDANGNILFNGLIFSKEGRYTYKVIENKNNVEGITYDEVARTVTIDVKLDKERGVLTSVVELPENKVFNNSYKPTTPPKGILPRTGIGALSSSIAGLGILSLVGLAIRRKQKMN